MNVITIKRSGFYLTCRDEFEDQAIWLAKLVEERAPTKIELGAGATFQVGWSILKLIETSAGLALCEPDFDSDPFNHFRNDVSTTLAVLLQQRDLLFKLGCDPVDIRFDDKVVMLKGCLEEQGIYGERSQPKKGDSGWYFGPTRDHPTPDSGDLEAILVFQLLHRRPHLLHAMCLPVNWIVVWAGTEIKGIANEDNQEVLR